MEVVELELELELARERCRVWEKEGRVRRGEGLGWLDDDDDDAPPPAKASSDARGKEGIDEEEELLKARSRFLPRRPPSTSSSSSSTIPASSPPFFSSSWANRQTGAERAKRASSIMAWSFEVRLSMWESRPAGGRKEDREGRRRGGRVKG